MFCIIIAKCVPCAVCLYPVRCVVTLCGMLLALNRLNAYKQTNRPAGENCGHLSYGAEISRWISMQTVAPLYLKCAILQTMKSQRSIRNELQYNAKQDLTSISQTISSDILVIWVFFVTKK